MFSSEIIDVIMDYTEDSCPLNLQLAAQHKITIDTSYIGLSLSIRWKFLQIQSAILNSHIQDTNNIYNIFRPDLDNLFLIRPNFGIMDISQEKYQDTEIYIT